MRRIPFCDTTKVKDIWCFIGKQHHCFRKEGSLLKDNAAWCQDTKIVCLPMPHKSLYIKTFSLLAIIIKPEMLETKFMCSVKA